MKNNQHFVFLKSILILISLLISPFLIAQEQSKTQNSQNEFWNNVQFGGGLGLGFGTGYTNISVAPSAIYNLNEYLSLGLGVQYAYAKQKNDYTSNLYGGSIIGLINPIDEIQLSAELEQLRVNVNYDFYNNSLNYWNTGLFLGAGYRTGNVTIGVRYDILHKDNKSVYSDAFIPFVRIYF